MEVSRTVLFCICVGLSASLPTNNDQPKKVSNFASDASQIIAFNMLKSNVDIDGNQIYSPLGVTSILAVLAEGASGATYDEFNTVFGYPKDRTKLRESFKRMLAKYQNHVITTDTPSFQTWLYIYRNFTVRDEFKQILQDHYFVDVKDINQNDLDVYTNAPLDLDTTTSVNKAGESTQLPEKLSVDEILAISSKPSKFDQHVDDKQYVEKPVILEELKKEEEEKKKTEEKIEKTDVVVSDVSDIETFEKKIAVEELKEKLELDFEAATTEAIVPEKNKREDDKDDDLNIQENETVQWNEKLSKNSMAEVIVPSDALSSNEPEKVTLPLEKLENAIDTTAKDGGEIMIALESHLRSVRRAFGSRSLFSKDDIASGLSANSIRSRDVNGRPKMLLFNGLYYRGTWATPFTEIRKSNSFFHMTRDDSMETTMMVARGKFRYAEIPHLNAKFICLPYENTKYAMVLVLPNEIEGLHELIQKFQPEDLAYAKENSKEEQLQVILPKFQVEETSRSESMLKNLGLQSLFSQADLSLLSADNDMKVDEIVQFVTVRVDEGGSSQSALSAIGTQGRTSPAAFEEFAIDHPFLYFVMDCEDMFVLAAGKVYAPEFKDEQPIEVEVQLN